MRVLALDASSKSGWALFVDGILTDSGALAPVKIDDFNVNKDPHLSPLYPYNIFDGARQVSIVVHEQLMKCSPIDVVVIENTNKGKNRHTQRFLEFMHFCILGMLRSVKQPMLYMDTSEWRKIVGLWTSKEDKKANAKLSKAKKAAEEKGKKVDKKALGIGGKISKKHLAVRMVNEKYGKKLKLKDNDEADAILMGLAYVTRSQQP